MRSPATPSRTTGTAAKRRGRLASILRALVLGFAAVVLCWPLTVGAGIAAAVVGAVAGALAADGLNARFPATPRPGKPGREAPQPRLASVLLVAFLTLVAGAGAARLLVSSSLVAAALGPLLTLKISEAMLWLSLVAPSVFALRYLTSRRPLWAVAEILAVALAVATGLAAHRGGMVHRPLAIGDWAWSQGIDPVLVFLVAGGAATLLLASLMLSEKNRRRIPLHLSALVLVALALLAIVRVGGLPKPQGAGDLGLTGEPEDGDEERGGEDGGKSDQMGDVEFKDEYRDSGNQAPVAVVLLHDDYSPPSGVYYFRQTVFSQFNGRRLVQALSGDVDRDVVKRFPFQAVEVAGAPPVSDRRMALDTSMGLVVDHVRPFALDSPAAIKPIKNPNPLHFQRAFGVRSHVQTLPYDDLLGQRAGDPDWSAETYNHYVETPSDPRYADLAARLAARLRPDYRDDPLAQAMAVKLYLDQNGIYSRKSKHAGASDPAASFLFGDLTGYCVHFAHAAAYLYRSLDLPARVAAGYAVEEAARAGGSTIMIRSGDAHAWPEIYLEDVGWVVVDLAPETTLDEPMQAPDQALQRMLGQMMREEGDEEWLEDQLKDRIDFAALGLWLLKILAALVALAYAVKLYRALVPRFARPGELYRVAYRAALDRLAGVGLRRRYGESRERFADRGAALAPSFVPLTEEHLKTALGSRRLAGAGALRQRLDAVARELRQRLPVWRRLLATLNPVSWMLAR